MMYHALTYVVRQQTGKGKKRMTHVQYAASKKGHHLSKTLSLRQ